ncbi:ATPase P [Methylovorus sp. MM2]|uniref:heavy metal translocating P-type ATPase n=1 Tax=Methylovorus sp. MM2 TaxID=1848038 RepID=UPI0007DEAAFF|nr:heavy metal translocating P-type ATPase [Methylovorus sp. MM2]OAM52415.1 ATPase P [Methylovorus sp. MM2]
MNADIACYHCGLPLTPGASFSTTVFNIPRAMCCHGCQAVAESIVANGLQDYYTYRTELPKTADELVPEELRQLDLYDHPEVQKSFVLETNHDIKEASLILEGITCAACIWLNERHLKQLKGVRNVAFNYASQRARISWDDRDIKLSRILAEIRKLGYHAHPFSAQQQDLLRQAQRKSDFRRLAVAGLSAGQVMMIAVALYAGADQGLEYATGQLLRGLSLVLSLPAMTYAAWPFYKAAWRGIVNHKIGMDVPIVLGLVTGFIGSIWATLHGGVVYYDTLTMLIFFLLTTRYLERNAREKSIEAAENLLRLAPAMATRVDGEQQTLIPLVELHEGDLILARPGETIAADGIVMEGESSADESLLTGESKPLRKIAGSHVYTGSINYESPLLIRVTGVGENTMLAGISRLLDRAQAEKPKLAQTADLVAAYFTYALLVVVAIVATTWWLIEPQRVLEIVLTVLVVSCPCALSLAAPAAFAAAGSHLIERGVLLTRGHALETLSKVTHFVFDKTGTLTVGRPVLLQVIPLVDLAVDECLKIAASLEQSSEHPIAKSFIDAMQHQPLHIVAESLNTPSQGVSGVINGKTYRIGNAALHGDIGKHADVRLADGQPGASIVWLSDAETLLAAFVLADSPRPDAAELIVALKAKGFEVSILSGDAPAAVAHFAKSLNIAHWQAALSPAQKLSTLQELQSRGAVVAMVGDGINDAPVLAGAQVSIAMGSGTQMARASGDIVLLTEKLVEIEHAVTTSVFGISVIRQNFIWALAYNLIALPFAALGWLSPWMAAIGMSVSSLIVVLNALRLR